MSLPVRVGTLLVAFLAVVGGAIFVVIHYLLAGPPTVDFTSQAAPGQPVHIVLQEAPQTTVSDRPDWVSYFIQDPASHQWVHTTLFKVPAGSMIDVTVLGYDGCTPLRNPFWGKISGTVGNVEYVNGKPTQVLNSWGECSVAHTFSIPGIGLNAVGVPGARRRQGVGQVPGPLGAVQAVGVGAEVGRPDQDRADGGQLPGVPGSDQDAHVPQAR